MHTPIEGVSIGQHPLLSRLIKGAFQTHPPLPRYWGTWDINTVLCYISGHCLDQSQTLMLLRSSQSADFAKWSIKGYRNTPEGAVFIPTALAKQSRPGRDINDFFFPKFEGNECLCLVRSLSLYMERKGWYWTIVHLLYQASSCSYLLNHCQVVEAGYELAGIDTSVFKAHSIRSTSTLAAAM